MKHLRLIMAFIAGFGLATALGLLHRMSNEARELNTASDVHHPLNVAIESIEESAKNGDCSKAATQLGVLKRRFGEYQRGGPTPANWYHEVTAATRPAG
jgi:hypothetical protein